MLTTIPIDVLKMDMKFVRNMLNDEKSLKLCELVMDISRFLDVPVVAEGVEEKAQLDRLKSMGCEIIQGYYFSKPVPADQFEQFIDEETRA
ncbi:MAG: EAL domain-containing protein [Lachnospiraceae bacterium]|nr:EAL domain-containing protein [Lachnospiraceae bacterium]